MGKNKYFLFLFLFTNSILFGMETPIYPRVLENVEKDFPTLKSIVIQNKGKIVYEGYFHKTSKDELINVYSITKTITGLAIAKLITDKKISSLEDKVINYYPELFYKCKIIHPVRNLKIKDLMAMQSGYTWNLYSQLSDLDFRINHIEDIIAKNQGFKQGTGFNYDDMNTHILSRMIEKLTGITLEDYCKKEIFSPIGIQNIKWIKDKRNHTVGGYGLWLKTEDVIKLSNYFSNHTYNRFIDSNAINKLLTISSKGGWPGMTNYGHLLWIETIENQPCYYGLGYNGQIMMYIPKMELSIVILNSNGLGLDGIKIPMDIIKKIINANRK